MKLHVVIITIKENPALSCLHDCNVEPKTPVDKLITIRTKGMVMFAYYCLNNFSLLLWLGQLACSWTHHFLCTQLPGWPADLEPAYWGNDSVGRCEACGDQGLMEWFQFAWRQTQICGGIFFLSFFGFPMNWLLFKFRVPSISRVRCLFRCERLGEIWNPSRTRLHGRAHTHSHTRPSTKITCFL